MYDALADLLGAGLNGLAFVGNVLDTPMSVARGLAAGDPGRAFGGIFDPEQRVGGRDLLEAWGVADENDPEAWEFADAAGLAIEMLDPLMLGAGALKLAGKGAKAAQAADRIADASRSLNILDDADIPFAQMLPLEHADQFAEPAGFYSRLTRAAEALPGDKFKAQSLPNLLKKFAPEGFAQEEYVWTKMPEFLAGKQVVTKDELLRHLDENALRVGDVRRGAGGRGKAGFEKYKIPGDSENYQEHLLTHASRGPTLSQLDDIHYEFEKRMHQKYGDGWVLKMSPKDRAAHTDLLNTRPTLAYMEPHFRKRNVLAHIRQTERPAPSDGGKMLFADEIQSEWHQTGKRDGYRPATGRIDSEGPEQFLPPDAPFKDAWPELALKKFLDDAARGDYTHGGWSSGEAIQDVVGGDLAGQQNFYDTVLPNVANKYFKRQGWDVQVEPAQLGPVPTPATSSQLHVPEEELLRRFGDVANRAEGQIPAFFDWVIHGPDERYSAYRAGGDMRAALQEEFNRLTDFSDIAPPVSPGIHQFPITPEMRRDILTKGQPLLSLLAALGGGYAMTGNEFDYGT